MLKNYITIAFRNLIRQKGYSVINILGLAIGLAAFILIVLHINDELSYDKFHDKSDRIYRLCIDGMISGDQFNVAVSAYPTAPILIQDLPQVVDACRIDSYPQSAHFAVDGKSFYQEGIIYADSSFFNIFSFKLLQGNPDKVLTEPYSIVITKSLADKYFYNENPVGKSIKLDDRSTFKITGIADDPPHNSHFSFDALISFATRDAAGNTYHNNWGSLSLYTYVLLEQGVEKEVVDEQLPDIYRKYMDEMSEVENLVFTPYLQPIVDIHLHSKLMAEFQANSDISYVYAFLAIAIFILVIACINFMNLSTARSLKRAREVGIRKVVGAHRMQLISQFLGESMILTFFGMMLALVLVEFALPTFNRLLDKELSISILSSFQTIVLLIGLLFVVSSLAGSYPAFFLSRFRPVKVLKGAISSKNGKKSGIRNVLVVIQFSISIFLLIATGFVYEQLSFISNKNLGFDKEQMMIIPLRGDNVFEKSETIKKELLNLSAVEAVSSSRFVPGKDMDGSGFIPEGYDDNDPVIIFNNPVDFNYIETMKMEIIEGRGFDINMKTDSFGVVINQTLEKKLGWKEPIGKTITGFSETGEVDYKVIGVVKDYHFRSLHDAIEPNLLFIRNNNNRNLNVRLSGIDVQDAVRSIESKWTELVPAMPFDYYFLDTNFDNLYRAEERIGTIFIYFTLMAIIIACLGLFGLASFNAEQKTREIGIRKALGASIQQIVVMLSKQFMQLVIIANLIAWPLAWFFLDEWLSNFAYAIQLGSNWWIFIMAAVVALIIAIITTAFQALKAALISPVEAIRYE